jgi:hypothetical protein
MFGKDNNEAINLEYKYNLDIEVKNANNFLYGCKDYFEFVDKILKEIRKQMDGENADFHQFVNNNEFKAAIDKIIVADRILNIKDITDYVNRFIESLILQQQQKQIVFVPAQLYHLTSSMLEACKHVDNMVEILKNANFTSELRRNANWEISRFLFEMYHINESIKSNFFTPTHEKYFNDIINDLK